VYLASNAKHSLPYNMAACMHYNIMQTNDDDNNKRPDGCSVILWRSGKPLTWDVIMSCTLAESYRKWLPATPAQWWNRQLRAKKPR